MVEIVRGALRRSGFLEDTDVPPDVIEGMMYGCKLSEVLTLCHTAASLQGLCVALRDERSHVSEVYEESREVERLWLEQRAAAAGPPQPPQEQWPHLPGVAGPSHAPPGHRRAHLTPGPGAEGARPSAVPPPGGTAAAGAPLPPPAGVWAPPAPAGAAEHAACPSPPSKYLPGTPEDPLYSYWAAKGGPPNPPAAQRAPRGTMGREMGKGGAQPVRACPYTDVKRNPGGATRAPGPATSGYGPAQAGGWGQPHRGWSQPPRSPPASKGHGSAQAHRGPARRTEADFFHQWGCGGTPPARSAGGPPVRPAAGAPAHWGPAATGGPPVRPATGAPAHGGPAGGRAHGRSAPRGPGPAHGRQPRGPRAAGKAGVRPRPVLPR